MNLQAIKSSLYKEAASHSGKIGYMIREGDEIISHNPDDIFSSASTIKLPLLIEAFRRFEKGLAAPEKMVPIHSHVGGSGVLQALTAAEMPFADLLSLMTIVSDNTATNLVIDELELPFPFHFPELGLRDTVLRRKMMDSVSLEKGIDNMTSPRDLDHCLGLLTDSSLLLPESRKSIWTILMNQQFKDKLPFMTEYTGIAVGNKTGGLPGIDHDCALFRFDGRTVAATVLCNGLDIAESRSFLNFTGKAIVEMLLGDE